MEKPELARRAALKVEASRFEDGAHELSATRALRLAHSMGVSIDELVERVYWNPGERVRKPGDRLRSQNGSPVFLSCCPPTRPSSIRRRRAIRSAAVWRPPRYSGRTSAPPANAGT